MILKIDDWVFDVDITATMEYSTREAAAHCDCAYCRNFYAAVDDTYPQIRRFLAQFGVDIEAPEELMPFDAILYLACYVVEGRIVTKGKSLIMLDSVQVMPETAMDAMINSGLQPPYFVLSVGPISLPWVLNEPITDVESPANEPSFLKRMWDRLLRRKTGDIAPS